jgi:YD repeat-containing protein
MSTVDTSPDGLCRTNTLWNGTTPVVSRTVTSYVPASGLRIVTSTAPDGSYTVATNQYGRLLSVTRRDASGNQIAKSDYGFDEYGRQNTITDARTGTTTSYFNNADQVSQVNSPPPASGQNAQITSSSFDSMGRVIYSFLPDNTGVTYKYNLAGLVTTNYGSRIYPVTYTYEAQGQVKTMTTWTNFNGKTGPATTTWNFDGYRGWQTGKVYADGKGPTYTSTPAGRLGLRTWARGTNTTYSFNGAGDLGAAPAPPRAAWACAPGRAAPTRRILLMARATSAR